MPYTITANQSFIKNSELRLSSQASLECTKPSLNRSASTQNPLHLCRGLLIRGGDILEEASHVKTIVFDKTGTLTEGRPRVQSVLAASPHLPEARLLALAAALERESSHPLASAILAAAQASGEFCSPMVDIF